MKPELHRGLRKFLVFLRMLSGTSAGTIRSFSNRFESKLTPQSKYTLFSDRYFRKRYLNLASRSVSGNMLAVSGGDNKVSLWRESMDGDDWDCISDLEKGQPKTDNVAQGWFVTIMNVQTKDWKTPSLFLNYLPLLHLPFHWNFNYLYIHAMQRIFFKIYLCQCSYVVSQICQKFVILLDKFFLYSLFYFKNQKTDKQILSNIPLLIYPQSVQTLQNMNTLTQFERNVRCSNVHDKSLVSAFNAIRFVKICSQIKYIYNLLLPWI